MVPAVPFEPLPDLQMDAAAKRNLEEQRLDLQQSPRAPLPGNGLYAFLDMVSKGAPYPINVMMVHEANPAYSLPENKLFQAALEKVGFLVSFSSYMDETAQQADLIMPNQMALERFDDAIGRPGRSVCLLCRGLPDFEAGGWGETHRRRSPCLGKNLGGKSLRSFPGMTIRPT